MGLCHSCWASNVDTEFDSNGSPECSSCRRRRNCHV